MNLAFWLFYDTKYYLYLAIVGICTTLSIFLVDFLLVMMLGPNHGLPSVLLGFFLGIIVGTFIVYWYDTKYDREERKRQQQEREENRALIDTSRCASCSTKMEEDEMICPSCGFDMSDVKALKSS